MTDGTENLLEEQPVVLKRSVSQPPETVELGDWSNIEDNGRSRGSIDKSNEVTEGGKSTKKSKRSGDFNVTRTGRLKSNTFDEGNRRSIYKHGLTTGTGNADWLFESLGHGLDVITGWHVINDNSNTNPTNSNKNNNKKYARGARGSIDKTETNAMITSDDKEEELQQKTGDCTFRETVFNCLNYVLGACTLAMPYAMSLCGFSCIILMAGICISTYLTATLLDEICSHFGHVGDYTEMVEAILGKKAKLIVGIVMCIELYLYVVLFFIFAGQILFDSGYLELANISISQSSCTVIMVISIFPTTFLEFSNIYLFIYSILSCA